MHENISPYNPIAATQSNNAAGSCFCSRKLEWQKILPKCTSTYFVGSKVQDLVFVLLSKLSWNFPQMTALSVCCSTGLPVQWVGNNRIAFGRQRHNTCFHLSAKFRHGNGWTPDIWHGKLLKVMLIVSKVYVL